jgi:hypothetical protein
LFSSKFSRFSGKAVSLSTKVSAREGSGKIVNWFLSILILYFIFTILFYIFTFFWNYNFSIHWNSSMVIRIPI